jgi:hypothetical protein
MSSYLTSHVPLFKFAAVTTSDVGRTCYMLFSEKRNTFEMTDPEINLVIY